MIVRPETVPELAAAVREAERVLPVGSGTKPALSGIGRDGAMAIDTGSLRGIVAYDPGELTFTARAGTPVSEVEAELAEHGQCLPFDPPLRAAGATLGGVVAAGMAGPGAFGAGVVRDFIIGIGIVDGRGRSAAAGGRVVKNAAGFDLAKLMVGSAGRLGVITEVSFKVFPRPRAAATVAFEAPTLAAAADLLAALGRSQPAIAALDLEPPRHVLARLEGDAELIGERMARLRRDVELPSEELDEAEAAALWEGAVECSWAPGEAALAAAPLTLADLLPLDQGLAAAAAARRYSLGGRLAWIAWPPGREIEELGTLLGGLGLSGMALRGSPAPHALLGAARGNAFAERVRAALDPDRRFLEIWP